MDETGKRRAALQNFVDRHGLKVTRWAKDARVSDGAVRDFLTGRNASMTIDTYDKLARAAGRPVTELLGEATGAPPGEIERVSVVGNVQAGLFKEEEEWPPDDRFEVDVPVDGRYRRLLKKALRVAGPSMNQVYPEGSFIVVIDAFELPDWSPRQGQHLVVRRRDRLGLVEHTVKEFRRDEAGRPWLWPRSDHPDFQQPWPLPPAEDGDGSLEVAAIVIGSYRPE